MSLEEQITQINEQGWKVNNLFQLDSGQWRASIRGQTHGFEFGEGASPEEALERALQNTTLGLQSLLTEGSGQHETSKSTSNSAEELGL